MKTIFVTGSLAYDRIMDFPGLFADYIMPDKIHSLSLSFVVDTLAEGFGGTAGNIAYNLALLSEKPILLANAGTDFGKYSTWLTSHDVDTTLVAVVPEKLTAVAHVITDKSDSQITAFYPGATGQPYTRKFSTADLAIVSPSNAIDMVQLPKKFKALKIPYFYDSGQQILALSGEDLREALPGAVAVFGNDYEMEMILRKLGWSKEKLLRHVPIVVTTFGAEGSLIATPQKEIQIRPVTATLIDPTGAGDAYRAGFAKGYLAGLPLKAVGQFASTVGAYAVEQQGTQEHRFTLEDLRQRYQDAYGEAFVL